MSIPLYLMASVLTAGIYLNRNGKQSRGTDNQRSTIPEDEKPSTKNIYHSEKYDDVYMKTFNEATKAHLKAQDPVNENVIPRFYNEMQTTEEISPEIQSYIDKRGSRFKYQEEATGRENFINEGGKEQTIEDSPMFNPLGLGEGKLNKITPGSLLTPEEKQDQVEHFSVSNRSTGHVSSTKQEHFGNFTVSGPRNSNNPNFHNNMVPFFGGHIYQNTDSHANQHLLERFTGQTNSDTELRSQPKREIPSLYDRTPGQTYIYGTPSENVNVRDRYQTSTLKTNVTPIEQTRVGPGISPGVYGSAPRDGFNTWYRPDFRNVDELRVNPKNQYEGRVLPGEQLVKNRGNFGESFKNRPDTFYVNSEERYFKTTGAFTAPQIRENFMAYKQNREDTTTDYTGIAGNGGVTAARPSVFIEGSNDCIGVDNCPKLNCHEVSINSQVQHTEKNQLPSTGLYRNLQGDADRGQTYFDDMARTTIRQNTHVMNYVGQAGNGENQRVKKYLDDEARATTKQTTHVMNYMGQVGSESNQRGQKYLDDDAKSTMRQTTHVMNYVGQVGNGENQRGQKYHDDDAKVTTKQTTHVMNYMGQVGSGETQRGQKYLDDDAKSTMRQTTHVMNYMGQIGNGENQRGQKYFDDDAKTTMKQTTYLQNYMGQVGNGENQRGQKYFDDNAKVTTKQTTHVKDYMGQVGNESNLRPQKYLDDEARATTRQTTHVLNYSGIAGNGDNSKPKSYEDVYNATNKNTQEVLLQNRAYGPNKATNISIGACDVNMQIRQRANYDITKWGPNENRLYTAIPNVGDNYQNTTTQNQRDQPGQRQPEHYVVQQFERNPYTQSLESAPRQTSSWVRGEVPFANQ